MDTIFMNSKTSDSQKVIFIFTDKACFIKF